MFDAFVAGLLRCACANPLNMERDICDGTELVWGTQSAVLCYYCLYVASRAAARNATRLQGSRSRAGMVNRADPRGS